MFLFFFNWGEDKSLCKKANSVVSNTKFKKYDGFNEKLGISKERKKDEKKIGQD